jgi:hypothetical protein
MDVVTLHVVPDTNCTELMVIVEPAENVVPPCPAPFVAPE